MGDCLRLSQLLRLLKNGDDKSVNHILYWMGPVLVDYLPDTRISRHALVSPAMYNSLAEVFTDMSISDAFNTNNWNIVTNRQLYRHRIASFPSPKVQEDADYSLKEIWRKLSPEKDNSTFLKHS